MKKLNELLKGTKYSVEKAQRGYRVWCGCEPCSYGLWLLRC